MNPTDWGKAVVYSRLAWTFDYSTIALVCSQFRAVEKAKLSAHNCLSFVVQGSDPGNKEKPCFVVSVGRNARRFSPKQASNCSNQLNYCGRQQWWGWCEMCAIITCIMGSSVSQLSWVMRARQCLPSKLIECNYCLTRHRIDVIAVVSSRGKS